MDELTELEQALLFFSKTLANIPDNSEGKILMGMILALNEIEIMSIEDKRELVDGAMKLVKNFRQECNYIVINED